MSTLAQHRRFTLLDLMILIAATAVGLAVVRDSLPGVLDIGNSIEPWVDVSWCCLGVLGAAPLVAFWSLGVLMCRLRQPRPKLRRLARQPGFVACAASVLGILPGVLMVIPYLLNRQSFDEWGFLAAYPIGYAVSAAWLTLAIGQRWRPVPDLFDRAGRMLGVYWITTIPLITITLFYML